jgi:hypothetical protein
MVASPIDREYQAAMRAFDRIFPLLAAVGLSVWLVVIWPIAIRYLANVAVFSADKPEETALTIAVTFGLVLFWVLTAWLVKLLVFDLLAMRGQVKDRSAEK